MALEAAAASSDGARAMQVGICPRNAAHAPAATICRNRTFRAPPGQMRAKMPVIGRPAPVPGPESCHRLLVACFHATRHWSQSWNRRRPRWPDLPEPKTDTDADVQNRAVAHRVGEGGRAQGERQHPFGACVFGTGPPPRRPQRRSAAGAAVHRQRQRRTLDHGCPHGRHHERWLRAWFRPGPDPIPAGSDSPLPPARNCGATRPAIRSRWPRLIHAA